MFTLISVSGEFSTGLPNNNDGGDRRDRAEAAEGDQELLRRWPRAAAALI